MAGLKQKTEVEALVCICGWTAGFFFHWTHSIMVLKDFSQRSGQESNMNRENVVTQLLPLQGCPVGDAHSASAAAWAGRSATRGKKNHFFSPSQFIKKWGF